MQKHTVDNENYHFDLMFEEGDVLATYQIKSIDDLLNMKGVEAINIQDHRLIYLDYEGEISNNRGYVKIFDKGEYLVKTKSINAMEYEVKGNILNGIISFSLLDSGRRAWELMYNIF